MNEQRNPDAGRETRSEEPHPDAAKSEAGAAGGALIGTALAGPLGAVAGAAAGAATGAVVDAGDNEDSEEPEPFEREGEPGDRRDIDLVDPRLGGHVGGSDPEGA